MTSASVLLPGQPKLLPRAPLRSTKCADVWWAVTRGPVEIAEPHPVGVFAVRLAVCAPVVALTPEHVKGLVDGVVASLQAHGDEVLARTAAPRVAGNLGVPADDVSTALIDTRGAVLGEVPDLLRRSGWHPGDDRCVAAELRVIGDGTWSRSGDVVSVTPE